MAQKANHKKRKIHAFVKIFCNALMLFVAIIVLVYVVMVKLDPNGNPNLFGYKIYTVLTDSMVPKLPVGSLVIDKAMDPDETIPENTPITFKTELQGKPVYVTHYFRYIDTSDGYERYMTQGENYGEGLYDDFKIRREDIVGVYAFHVPYLGRIAMFLQSPAALTLFFIWGFLLLLQNMVTKWIDAKFPEDEEALIKPKNRVKVKKQDKGRYLKGQSPKHRPTTAPPLKRPTTREIKG